MDRRQFLIGGTALAAALAGCSRAVPSPEPTPRRVTMPSPTPTPTPTPAPPKAVAAGTSMAEQVMQAVAMKSLDARGYSGRAVPMPPGGAYGLTAAVAANSVQFAVVFAATLLDSIASTADPPAPDELVPTLATALDADEVAVLANSPADGHLVWVAPPNGSLADLGALSGKKYTASVPAFVLNRADGIPALQAVYGAKLAVTTDDDPRSRRDALVAGRADLSVFRACDVAELDGMRELDDPSGIVRPDPMIVVFDAWLTDGDPASVLAITDALTALGVDGLATLEAAAYNASGIDARAVATKWVSEHLPPG